MVMLYSVLILLVCVHTTHLRPSKVIKVPKLPDQCEVSYMQNPTQTKPFLKCTCIFQTLPKGESLSYLQDLSIKSLFVRWFCHSGEELKDGVFSKLKNLEGLSIGGCFKKHITHNFFKGLEDLKGLIVSVYDLHGPTFGPKWLTPLKNLEELNLFDNHIVSFPAESFCGAKNLRRLNIRYNNLHDSEDLGLKCVDSTNQTRGCHPCLPNLTSLDLSGNLIPVLNVSFSADMPRLKYLMMRNSNLSDLIGIDSQSIMIMTKLDFSNNALSSFTIKDIEKCNGSQIETLNLANNHLSVISKGLFLCFGQLRYLDLARNNLSVEQLKEGGISDLSAIEHLNISDVRMNTLQAAILGNMKNLKQLSCNNCGMTSIEADAFLYTTKLQILVLKMNRLTNISSDIFINLQNLVLLDLSGNELLTFEASRGILSLVQLYLSGNNLQELPDFTGSYANLTVLDLSRNNISKIQFEGLTGLPNLEDMNLAFNKIRSIPAYTFWRTTQLINLDMSNNEIDTIVYHSFIGISELKELNLQNNLISNLNKSLLFMLSSHRIYMSGNLITKLDNDNFQQSSIKWIDLSWNQVSHIDLYLFDKSKLEFVNLTYNKLHYLDMRSLKIPPDIIPRPQLLLQGNLLHCDCHNDILTITKSGITAADHYRQIFAARGIKIDNKIEKSLRRMGAYKNPYVQIPDLDLVYCDAPHSRTNHSVASLQIEDFLCPYQKYKKRSDCTCVNQDNQCCVFCYTKCSCYHSGYNLVDLMDCSSRNLTSLPPYWPQDTQEIFLDNNGIGEIKKDIFTLRKLPKLEKLYLQENKIHMIENESFSDLHILKTLWLHNNSLRSLNLTIFDGLFSLQDLTLHGNPWQCSCSFGPALQKFITERIDIISNAKAIFCEYSNSTDIYMQDMAYSQHNEPSNGLITIQPLLEIDFSFCENITHVRTIHHRSSDYAPGLITMTIVLLSLGCLVVAVYKNHILLKVLIYNRFGVHFHREHDDDEEKPYDVFLAHSRGDDLFVIESLLPGLEDNQPSYKVCLESRDWPAGDFITDTIIASVEQSKRTILLISEHYFETPWCEFTFQAAHYQVLKDKQIRLILVLMDMNLKARMEKDMKLYLKTGTYLVYGEKWFWPKLQYYLADNPRGSTDPEERFWPLNIYRSQSNHHYTPSVSLS